jgi:hypothetical protein
LILVTDGAQALFQDGRINVSFSKVEYRLIAPLVGLDADQRLADIQTFELCRSRIPTELFRSIVQDIDIMQVQYGPPLDHETEQARSQFLSPVSASQLFTWQSKSKLP